MDRSAFVSQAEAEATTLTEALDRYARPRWPLQIPPSVARSNSPS